MYNTNVGEILDLVIHTTMILDINFLLHFLAALVYGVSKLPRHCIPKFTNNRG